VFAKGAILLLTTKKLLMKKLIFFSFLTVTSLGIAQPHMFVVGPSYEYGLGTFNNAAFTRTYDGTQNVFTDTKQSKLTGMGAGLLMEMNFKHSHWAMNLVLPFKNKFKDNGATGNFMPGFNLSGAWGGYIKEKYGILGGASLIADFGKFDNSQSSIYTAASMGMDPKTNGNYYMPLFLKGGASIDAHFIYAITEQFVARATYSIIGTSLKKQAGSTGTTYDSKGIGSRFEAGLFYQISDNFGFFGKMTYTNYRLKSATATVTSGSSSQQISLFPVQNLSSMVFTVGIMIPLGSAESRRTTVTVTPTSR
jgi:hypothetical protein